MSVRKAVFPVAGLGTRFFPATKVIPKEMLPIVDKPLIQYAVEEAVTAGVTELIFITNPEKQAIAEHLHPAEALEKMLMARGKTDELAELQSIIPAGIKTTFINQGPALGLGHAVLCAKHAVGNEPFIVILPDDLIATSGSNALQQLVAQFENQRASIIAVEPILPEKTRQYGVVDVDERGEDLMPLKGIVEKPAPEEAPSYLGVVGRYVLTPEIFHALENIGTGSGGEIQLTDAIAALLASQSVYAYRFAGIRYDCGNKLGYLRATVAYGLNHPILGKDFARMLSVEFGDLFRS